VLATQAKADLVVDGGFETPTVPTGGYSDFTTGMSFGSAWTVQGTDVAIVSTTNMGTDVTANAHSGNQSLDLTGAGTNPADGVTQTLATTSGTGYTITFWLGRADDTGANPRQYSGAASLTLSIGGGAAVSYTNSGVSPNMVNWAQETTSFTASSASTTITFLASGVAANVQYIGLDDVSVNPTTVTSAVPEPNTLVLAGIGSLLVCWAKFRRRGKMVTA
jgi:hypothetical protein